ncbi:hypothetical protein P154DRAFT_421430 [Amniculicola lignicola CBS 123094]|uniref:Xylanolytic transcriptional activator regulatory domain-containing protein n=1 Tax=Amniculicola lignicola CBS 123094 TaxID=1392246 RepID=A0A6A5X2Z2_9PLEO|nr:hypothetical protein P154DRAFT_421430 [Amniculicola lignicola CBS 123094]
MSSSGVEKRGSAATVRVSTAGNRIQRLETLLEERTADQPTVRAQPLPPADKSIPLSYFVTDLRDEVTSWPIQEGPQLGPPAFDEGFDGVDFDEENPLNFDFDFELEDVTIPQTTTEESGVFVQPPPEPEVLLEFQHDPDLLRNLTLEQTLTATTSETSGSLSSQPLLTRARCDGYLPSPELGTSLLREFLVDFNTAIPLYRPSVVVEQLRLCFTGGSDGTRLAWATVYTVLGIAHRLRAMSAAATPEDNLQADYYLSRVLCAVPDLLLAEASLPLIQCLLGLAFLIQTSRNSAPHSLFITTALRMAQCLAYNDDLAQAPDADIEQQHRVFWIAFFGENDASIVSNAPTTHRRDDIAAIYPREDPHALVGAVVAAEGSWKVNMFTLRVCLAMHQAEAIEEVFSIQARKNNPQDNLVRAERVARHLARWRTHELFSFSTEQLEQMLYRSDLIHVVNLEASYFATTHRLQSFLASGLDTRVNPFSVDFLTRFVTQKEYRCLSDAKKFLSLLSVVPQGDIGLCWMIKLPIVAALCTVLGHVLHHAQEKLSATEVHNYSRIVQTMTTLALKNNGEELQRARKLCLDLFERAVGAMTAEMQVGSLKEGDFDPSSECPVHQAAAFVQAIAMRKETGGFPRLV